MINPFLWVMCFFIGMAVVGFSIWLLWKYDDWEEKRNCPHKKYCSNCVLRYAFYTNKLCEKCNKYNKFKCRICKLRGENVKRK